MSRRNLSRLVLVGVLASLLALAGPAQAQAADLVSPGSIRHWLVSLWEKGVSVLATWSKTATDQGLGIVPNGGTTQGSGGPGSSPNGGTPQGDVGPGIDPNG